MDWSDLSGLLRSAKAERIRESACGNLFRLTGPKGTKLVVLAKNAKSIRALRNARSYIRAALREVGRDPGTGEAVDVGG